MVRGSGGGGSNGVHAIFVYILSLVYGFLAHLQTGFTTNTISAYT